MIRVILWDIDGTLLDFAAAEREAIRSCFAKFGLGECSDEMLARYSVINRQHWEKLERKELPREEAIAWAEAHNEPYKKELIEDLPEDAVISFYTQGDFTDLCAGPHLDHTGRLRHNGFKAW